MGITDIAFPDKCRLVFPPGLEVSVNTVVSNVYLTPNKPLMLCIGKIIYQNFVPCPEPIELFRHLRPETLRVINRFLINLTVLIQISDISFVTEFLRRIENPPFL